MQAWTDQRFLDHINPDTVLVYRLVAGQLDDVIPELDLDWRRAFNLHLWWVSHIPVASTSDMMRVNTDAAAAAVCA